MKHEEHKIQCAIVRLLRLNGIFCFAIPNGEKREKKSYIKNGKTCWYSPAGVRLKEEGVLAGVADIEIWINHGTLFVDVKTKDGIQSDAQKDFEVKAIAHGYKYQVWRSLDDAIDFVNAVKFNIGFAKSMKNLTFKKAPTKRAKTKNRLLR